MTEETWNPDGYNWDPENLVALHKDVTEESTIKRKKRGRAQSKRKGKSVHVYCQIDGCALLLDTTYYKVRCLCRLGFMSSASYRQYISLAPTGT